MAVIPQDRYKITYDNNGKAQQIHLKIHNTWATIPFDPIDKSFDESNKITKYLRALEAEFSPLDLSDRSAESSPLVLTTTPSGEAMSALVGLQPGQVLSRDNTGQWTAVPLLAENLSAEPLGAAANAVIGHEQKLEPHPQYATDVDLATHASNKNNPHAVTISQVGGDPSGTAASAVAGHKNETAAHALNQIIGLQNALDSKENAGTAASAILAHVQAADPHAGYILEVEKGAANGVAPLDSNKLIPEVFLPAIAITDTYVVNTEAAMLALAVQRGDVAIRSDLNKSFILKSSPATSLSNWQELPTPTDQVLSVNGKSGVVVLTAADLNAVGLGGDQTIEGLKAFGGILRALGAVNEASLGFNRIDFGVQNGTPRIVFEQVGFSNWQVDSSSGMFRWYTPGVTHMSLDPTTGLALRLALPVNQGGTGAKDAATARTNLGINSASWANLTLQNSWTNASGTARYTKLSDGLVVVEGLLTKLLRPTAGETIATLPASFRPTSGALRFSLVDSSTSRPYVEVSTAGVISYGNSGTIPNTITNLSLTGIAFYGA